MRFLFFVWALFFLASCDTRKNVLKSKLPVSKIQVQRFASPNKVEDCGDLKDTIKLFRDYTLGYELKNPQKKPIIETYLHEQNVLVKKEMFSFDDLKGEISFKAQAILYNVKIQYNVPFGTSVGCAVRIVVLANVPPVPKMNIEVSKNDVSVDLSGSYDPDEKYGGGIKNYELTITGQDAPEVVYNTTQYKKTLGKGTYGFSFRCQDNDGVWSHIVNKTIKIE
jgi:hypothetical protein